MLLDIESNALALDGSSKRVPPVRTFYKARDSSVSNFGMVVSFRTPNHL